jgi:hypothetical protein
MFKLVKFKIFGEIGIKKYNPISNCWLKKWKFYENKLLQFYYVCMWVSWRIGKVKGKKESTIYIDCFKWVYEILLEKSRRCI